MPITEMVSQVTRTRDISPASPLVIEVDGHRNENTYHASPSWQKLEDLNLPEVLSQFQQVRSALRSGWRNPYWLSVRQGERIPNTRMGQQTARVLQTYFSQESYLNDNQAITPERIRQQLHRMNIYEEQDPQAIESLSLLELPLASDRLKAIRQISALKGQLTYAIHTAEDLLQKEKATYQLTTHERRNIERMAYLIQCTESGINFDSHGYKNGDGHTDASKPYESDELTELTEIKPNGELSAASPNNGEPIPEPVSPSPFSDNGHHPERTLPKESIQPKPVITQDAEEKEPQPSLFTKLPRRIITGIKRRLRLQSLAEVLGPDELTASDTVSIDITDPRFQGTRTAKQLDKLVDLAHSFQKEKRGLVEKVQRRVLKGADIRDARHDAQTELSNKYHQQILRIITQMYQTVPEGITITIHSSTSQPRSPYHPATAISMLGSLTTGLVELNLETQAYILNRPTDLAEDINQERKQLIMAMASVTGMMIIDSALNNRFSREVLNTVKGIQQSIEENNQTARLKELITSLTKPEPHPHDTTITITSEDAVEAINPMMEKTFNQLGAVLYHRFARQEGLKLVEKFPTAERKQACETSRYSPPPQTVGEYLHGNNQEILTDGLVFLYNNGYIALNGHQPLWQKDIRERCQSLAQVIPSFLEDIPEQMRIDQLNDSQNVDNILNLPQDVAEQLIHWVLSHTDGLNNLIEFQDNGDVNIRTPTDKIWETAKHLKAWHWLEEATIKAQSEIAETNQIPPIAINIIPGSNASDWLNDRFRKKFKELDEATTTYFTNWLLRQPAVLSTADGLPVENQNILDIGIYYLHPLWDEIASELLRQHLMGNISLTMFINTVNTGELDQGGLLANLPAGETDYSTSPVIQTVKSDTTIITQNDSPHQRLPDKSAVKTKNNGHSTTVGITRREFLKIPTIAMAGGAAKASPVGGKPRDRTSKENYIIELISGLSDDLIGETRERFRRIMEKPFDQEDAPLRIFDRNGRFIDELRPDGKIRYPIALPDIEQAVYSVKPNGISRILQALIATEDKHLLVRDGSIAFEGIVRALYANIQAGQITQGGSTLIQQVIRHACFSQEELAEEFTDENQRWRRKQVEIFLSLAAWEYWKERFGGPKEAAKFAVNTHLNTAFFGRNAYGIEAAAKAFFDKSTAELELHQAAYLIGLLQSPGKYSLNHQEAKARQEVVLDLMAETKFITPHEATEAKKEPLAIATSQETSTEKQTAWHFAHYARQQVKDLFGEEDAKRGLQVRTSLDLDLQHQVEKIVEQKVAELGPEYGFSNAACVVINPETGELLSMVSYNPEPIGSGKDNAQELNLTLQPRQPGSTLKPFLYSLLMMFNKYNSDTKISDAKLVLTGAHGEQHSVPNYGGKRFEDLVPLRKALGNSINREAVRGLYELSIPRMLDFADRLGITSLKELLPDRINHLMAIGANEVSLFELTYAYGALANLGNFIRHCTILSVNDLSGRTVYQVDSPQGDQIIDEQVATDISNILSDPDARRPTFGKGFDIKRVSQKTGTSGTNEQVWDNWAFAYIPKTLGENPVVVAVWIGNHDRRSLKPNASGARTAAKFTKEIIAQIRKNQ